MKESTDKVKLINQEDENPSERTYILDYGTVTNFRYDVTSAVKFFLELGDDFKYKSHEFGGFKLYPQALNPFLKIMETLNESRNIVILPSFNNEDDSAMNQPAYLILKIDGDGRYVTKFATDNI